MDDEENEQEGEEQGAEDEDGEGEGGTSYLEKFTNRWGWISWVDSVAETLRVSWDDVFNRGVVEFFNIVCYIRDKRELEAAQQKEYEKKLRRK